MAANRKVEDGSEPAGLETEEVEANTDNDNPDLPDQSPSDEGDGPDAPEDAEEKLRSAEAEAKETYDRFLRVSAEFDNYKKRSKREMSDFRKYANEAFIREMLPVVDNLERAIASGSDSKDVDSLLEGIELTLKDILKIFERFAVEPIEAAGAPFDPAFHQAVMQEETGAQPENTVIKELQRGYTIHDRLLRPTMVVVSKAPANEVAGEQSTPQQEEENEE